MWGARPVRARDARSPGVSPESLFTRSRAVSPEERQFSATQPARSPSRPGSPTETLRPSTQPELSKSKKPRSAKSRASGSKSKKRADTSHSDGHDPVQYDEDAILYEEVPSKKKRKRRSDAAPHRAEGANGSPPAVVGDVPLAQIRSPSPLAYVAPERHHKNKGKGKEVIRDVAGSTIFDLDDEPPPSAQPPAKRDRRGSSSKSLTKRKFVYNGGLGLRPTAESSDEPVQRADQHVDGSLATEESSTSRTQHALGSPAPPGDDTKVVGWETEVVEATQSWRKALPELSPVAYPQRSQSDSGYAEANWHVPLAGISEPERGGDMRGSNGLLGHAGNPLIGIEGGGVLVDDDRMSIVSDSPGLPIRSDSPYAPAAEDGEDNEATDVAEPHGNESRPHSLDIGDDPEATSNEVRSAGRVATTGETRPHRPKSASVARDEDGEPDGATEGQQHLALEDGVEGVITTPASSSRTPKSRQTTKRKAKRPFFIREEEENARGFSELPPDDAVIPPMEVRLKRDRAESEAGPSTTTRGSKKAKEKPKKRSIDDTAPGYLDDAATPGRSQYRSGALTETEQSQIVAAVERFQEDEGLTREEINKVIHENPQRNGKVLHRQLWASVQDACPSRPRKKLINWCRLRFHNFDGRATWTKEQDDQLAEMVQLHGKSWSKIAGLINRHQKDVRDRWRNYLVCRNHKTDAWSDGEEERLRELVTNSIRKIQNELRPSQNPSKSPEELINWLKISESMGYTRSRLQCMYKWKRMRAAEPVSATVLPSGSSWRLEKARKELRKISAQEKYTLMSAIRDLKVGTDDKIHWKTIEGKFHGKYERQTLIVTWGRLRQAVPDSESKRTYDCAKYLCEMYEREGVRGIPEFDQAEESEHDASEGAAGSAKDRGDEGKGKDVAPSSSTKLSIPALQKQSASRPKSKKKVEVAAAEEGDENLGEDSGNDGTALAQPSCRSEQVEKTEPGADSPQPSPSLEAQAARIRRREKGSRAGENADGTGKGPDVPGLESRVSPAKGSKRARRDSLSSDKIKSPKLKRHKTFGASPGTKYKSKGNNIKKREVSRGEGERTNDVRAPSAVSSDMSDMEDIPATILVRQTPI